MGQGVAGGNPAGEEANVWPENKTAAYSARVHEHHVVAVGNTTDIHYFDLRMVQQVCRSAQHSDLNDHFVALY